ncbi:Ig-like domain-containing protein, partial [Enterobacter hormaechei]
MTLKDADGNTIGTGKAGSDRKFTRQRRTPLRFLLKFHQRDIDPSHFCCMVSMFRRHNTTPPDAPPNLEVSPDGKTVTGTAEPGSTVTLKDADGNTIGTGKAGS